jgi:GxxExxY protein
MEGSVMSDELIHKDITDRIINAFYTVYNTLGWGFLERVYENAVAIELQNMGFAIERQRPLKIYYRQHLIGEYFADIVVEQKVIVELKAVETVHQTHIDQLQNYLRATQIEVGLLLNFGRRPEFKRRVFTNARKGSGIVTQPDQPDSA